MQNPLFNITMPVFNRFLLTQKTILRLQKLKARTQCTLTVVDNGSEDALRERLIAFAKEGFIDKLFILPRNMGISFACNLGWKATPAPYFIKIDNDITITNPDFLLAIEGIYAIIEKNATLGPEPEIYGRSSKFIPTPYGSIGICTSNLPGAALIIPRSLAEIVGYFNEDYGLYGAEDADYGFRMNFLGLHQYFFESNRYLIHEGKKDSSEYAGLLNKEREHATLFKAKDGGIGLLALNACLFELCVRNWNVPPRYQVTKQEGFYVDVCEREDYALIADALSKSKAIFDAVLDPCRKRIRLSEIPLTDDQIAQLKAIWKACGQECKLP